MEATPVYIPYCSNYVADSVYSCGTYLMSPFLAQMDLIVQITTLNFAPGNTFSELPLNERVWKVLKYATVFTVIIPAVTCLIAGVGLTLRIAASPFYADAYILENEKLPYKTIEGKTGDRISVQTRNVQLMPEYISSAKDTRSARVRAEEIGLELINEENGSGAPDILCLQECFARDSLEILLPHLRTIYPNIICCVAPGEPRLGAGLLIASKFNIKNYNVEIFSDWKDEDGLANKGVLEVCLRLNETMDLFVFNTHFQAKTGTDYDDVRFDQYEQMKAFADDIYKRNQCKLDPPMLFAGDFNGSKLLGDVPMCNNGTFYNLNRAESGWGTSKWDRSINDEEGVLDHIFFYKNSDFMVKEVKTIDVEPEGAASGMSDHLIVHGELELRKNGDSA